MQRAMKKAFRLVAPCLFGLFMAGCETYEPPQRSNAEQEAIERNIAIARELHVKAEQGDAEAQYKLGQMYSQYRTGFSPNYDESAYWFGQAAEQGYRDSRYRLARAISKKASDTCRKQGNTPLHDNRGMLVECIGSSGAADQILRETFQPLRDSIDPGLLDSLEKMMK